MRSLWIAIVWFLALAAVRITITSALPISVPIPLVLTMLLILTLELSTDPRVSLTSILTLGAVAGAVGEIGTALPPGVVFGVSTTLALLVSLIVRTSVQRMTGGLVLATTFLGTALFHGISTVLVVGERSWMPATALPIVGRFVILPALVAMALGGLWLILTQRQWTAVVLRLFLPLTARGSRR